MNKQPTGNGREAYPYTSYPCGHTETACHREHIKLAGAVILWATLLFMVAMWARKIDL